MIHYTHEMLKEYLKKDWIAQQLEQLQTQEDKLFRTHVWLSEMDNKRMIYGDMYGNILKEEGKKIFDIGGGYTALTRKMVAQNDYYLLDFMAHGEHENLHKIEKELKKDFWIAQDWYDYKIDQEYDLILANDLFPDVDQRLELFIDKFLPHCKELRMLVTYYNKPKFYRTNRTDDSEILTFLSWDGEITALKLKKYLPKMIDTTQQDLDLMKSLEESIYYNGRQVTLIRMKGGLS